MKYIIPRGTRDLLPEQAAVFRKMEETAVRISELYGYGELRTPIFEHTEVFERGVGDTTDIVEKEMYSFTSKGDKSLTLRPEGTAPVVRSFVENKLYNGVLPAKYFYFGPMFRYERPQAGRYRQFWQFGIELFGSAAPAADVEVIVLALDFFRALGLEDVELILNSIGCTSCRGAYREKLTQYLSEKELCENCQGRLHRNPLRVLDCKNQACAQQFTEVPLISEHLCHDCREHFTEVKAELDELGVKYTLDGRLVRGLDYYNRTTFEFKSRHLGAQDAVGGGGRYDGLVELLGGPATPAVGFALGFDRLALLNPSALNKGTERRGVWLASMPPVEAQARTWVYQLRSQGVYIESDLMGRSFKAQFKHADRGDFRYALVVGPSELESRQGILKDLVSGSESAIALDQLTEVIPHLEGVK